MLVIVLDDLCYDGLRPYVVQSLACNVEIKFDRVVGLLVSSYIENERRQSLSKQEDPREVETALTASGEYKRNGICRHCGMNSHLVSGVSHLEGEGEERSQRRTTV